MKKKGQINQVVIITVGLMIVATVLGVSLYALEKMSDVFQENTISSVDTTGIFRYNLTSLTFSNLTATSTQKYVIDSIKPNSSFTLEITQVGSGWNLALGYPVYYLRLKGNITSGQINASTMVIKNGSTVINSTNYTVTNIAGLIVYINMSSNASFLNDNLTIIYNRTFLTTENLVGDDYCYPSTDCLMNTSGVDDYGETHYFKTLNQSGYGTANYSNGLDNRNYSVYYTLTTTDYGVGSNTVTEGTDEMITTIGDVPGWIGILIISIFGVLIIGLFIGMRYLNPGN